MCSRGCGQNIKVGWSAQATTPGCCLHYRRSLHMSQSSTNRQGLHVFEASPCCISEKREGLQGFTSAVNRLRSKIVVFVVVILVGMMISVRVPTEFVIRRQLFVRVVVGRVVFSCSKNQFRALAAAMINATHHLSLPHPRLYPRHSACSPPTYPRLLHR